MWAIRRSTCRRARTPEHAGWLACSPGFTRENAWSKRPTRTFWRAWQSCPGWWRENGRSSTFSRLNRAGEARGANCRRSTVKRRKRKLARLRSASSLCTRNDGAEVDERSTQRPTRSLLEDFLPKRREGQLHGQIGGLVVLVDHRIHFDDFEAQHAAVVRDDLHGEVSFAICGAAPHRCAHAGSVFGIDPVHVEGDVIAGRAASGHAEGFFHDGAHTTLVDIAHGEDFYTRTANVFLLVRVDIANAYQHAILRPHLRREIENVPEFGWPQAHDGRKRHPVHVSAGRGFGSV